MLYIDSSEAITNIGKNVIDFFNNLNINVTIRPLISDYFFETNDGLKICIERTNPNDFWNKIVTGRLFEQFEMEIRECDELYYVISGYNELGKMLRFTGEKILASFEGALTSISRHANLIVLWRDDRFPHWLKILYEKYMVKDDTSPLGRKIRKRDKHPCESAIDILMGFPNVGIKTAMEILNDYDSLGKVFKEMLENPEVFWAKYVSRRSFEKTVSIIKMEGCREWLKWKRSK